MTIAAWASAGGGDAGKAGGGGLDFEAKPSNSGKALWRIRLLHTLIWGLFATAILAIPVAVLADAPRLALWLSILVFVEVAVLLANRMRCPLTGVAARYTADRADNFDIFLPAWLARQNKLIFGALVAAAEFLLLWRWLYG
jgi:hypothetical protein